MSVWKCILNETTLSLLLLGYIYMKILLLRRNGIIPVFSVICSGATAWKLRFRCSDLRRGIMINSGAQAWNDRYLTIRLLWKWKLQKTCTTSISWSTQIAWNEAFSQCFWIEQLETGFLAWVTTIQLWKSTFPSNKGKKLELLEWRF